MKMKKGMKFAAILMVLLAVFMFTACDGSSSDELFDGDNGGDGPTPPPVPTTVAVESVSLNPTNLTLKTGKDGTLTATVLPENATDKSVTWSSDKPEVATVDQNGKVTGIAEGTAKIKVITTDGAKTAICVVTVSDVVYTVSFNVQGHGTAPEALDVAPGGLIAKPDDPVAEGFKFKYWYKDTETEEWNFDTDTVTADMTLYAKWVNVYKVSFVGNNGGSDTMDPVYVEAGTSYTIPASTFTAPAIDGLPNGVASNKKFFTCWKNGTDDITTPTITVTGNIELTAQWAKPSFTVSGTKKVYFSQGNLWYGKVEGATDATFNFENDQYSYQKEYDSTWENNNHISHFYWSKDARVAYSCKYTPANTTCGITPDVNDVFFTNEGSETTNSDFIVNGEKGKYRALSSAEWSYLLNRDNKADGSARASEKRFAICKYDTDKIGLLIFPDGWKVWPSNAGEEPTYNKTTWINCGSKIYNTDELKKLCASGAVFLPAAGSRYNLIVSNVGSDGLYFSSTPNEDTTDYAYRLYFYDIVVHPANSSYRDYACSIRLVVEEK